jgi:uncharacterized protein YcfJ
MSARNRKAVVTVAATALAVASLGFSASAAADHKYRSSYNPVAYSKPGNAYGHQRHRGAQYDYAPVISAEPIIRYVTVKTPVRECWTETRYVEVEHRRHRNTGGSALVGAIVGGVVGHQFGSGRGNDAATVAGSLIGAAIGSESARRHNRNYGSDVYAEPVERCATTMQEHQEERIDGYRVVYRYNGQKYATELPYDPGREIRVRVDVRPAG